MRKLCLAFVVAVFFGASVSAETLPNYREIYQFTWENDIASGDDGRYTNGFAFGYSKGPFDQFDESSLPSWIRTLASPLPFYDDPSYRKAASHIFGQTMQTPDDITIAELQKDDLPYAGFLFWQGRLYFINSDWGHETTLTLGVVGELSGAEQLQTLVHDITGSDDPEGWDNQLSNEPVVNLGYSVRKQLFTFQGRYLEWDIVPQLVVQAGNLTSNVGAGVNFRFGENLNATWGTSSLISGRKPDPLAGNVEGSWYFSIGAGGQYVVNDLLVEGNTWESSHGLSVKHERTLYSVAASYSFGNWAVIWNFSSRSETAKELDGSEEFGSLSIAMVLD